MAGEIKVLVACGSGIATSTVIANRVKEICGDAGYPVSVTQVKVVEVEEKAPNYDLVVTSTQIPDTVTTPHVRAIAYLTGVGKEKVDQEILDKVKKIAAEK
jgi:PTS system galactitol-specific IIB component